MRYRCNGCGTIYDAKKIGYNIQNHQCQICKLFRSCENYLELIPDTGRTLTVEFNYGEKTCEKCRFFIRNLYEDDVDDYCNLFDKSLNEQMNESDLRVYRLPECIAACGGQNG